MLSKKTKYALKSLMHLSKSNPSEAIQAKKIAEDEHIPLKFLESILLDLKNAGILRSRKGRGGGYYLLKETSKISVADIMRLFEGPIALLPCATHNYYEKCEECKDENACGIRDVFIELRNISVNLLKNTTLDELMKREDNPLFIKSISL